MIRKLLNNKITKNAAWIILCRVVQAAVSMVIAIITARYLGPSNYGVINYAASLTSFVAPLMYLGLTSTLVQELVLDPKQDGSIMGTAIGMSLLSALVCMAGIGGFITIAKPGETETLIVCVLYSTLLLFQAVDLLRYWFLSKYLSKISSIAMLIAYVVAAIYKIILLIMGKGVVWFAVTNSIEYMLIAVILFVLYHKKGGGKLRFSWETGKRLLKRSGWYILSGLMVNAYLQFGKIAINMLMDDASTGYYSAAVALTTMTSFVFQAIIDSFRPEILKHSQDDGLEQSMTNLYSLVIYLALAQAVVISVFAKPIIHLIYGQAYYPAVTVVRMAVWQSMFSYLGYAKDIWILAAGKQKYLWIVNMFGAVTNISLNLLLIPRVGLVGAAVASVATELMANVVVFQLIKPLRRNNVLLLKAFDIRNLIALFKSK